MILGKVMKIESKIGPTDSCKKVSQNMMNIIGGPQHADNKTFQKNSFSKSDEDLYILL